MILMPLVVTKRFYPRQREINRWDNKHGGGDWRHLKTEPYRRNARHGALIGRCLLLWRMSWRGGEEKPHPHRARAARKRGKTRPASSFLLLYFLPDALVTRTTSSSIKTPAGRVWRTGGFTPKLKRIRRYAGSRCRGLCCCLNS